MCYVSPAQFLAHIRKHIKIVAICFITDFLGQMRIGELFDEDEFEDNKNS